MLQAGDRILFVDNISLRNKTVNEINQLLRANEEVVKLKIKKDEVYTGKRESQGIDSFLLMSDDFSPFLQIEEKCNEMAVRLASPYRAVTTCSSRCSCRR